MHKTISMVFQSLQNNLNKNAFSKKIGQARIPARAAAGMSEAAGPSAASRVSTWPNRYAPVQS
jgi:hypothetical protein